VDANRILIVGGGIAGLSLDLALGGGPWQVDLVERGGRHSLRTHRVADRHRLAWRPGRAHRRRRPRDVPDDGPGRLRQQSQALTELVRLPPGRRDLALRERGIAAFYDRYRPLTAAP
jgi:glycine/D-amino acid oxidase-like deaminating enzyme